MISIGVLLHALSHKTFIVRRFLVKQITCVLKHPPYSYDLPPYDFPLFPTPKSKIKWCYCNDQFKSIPMRA